MSSDDEIRRREEAQVNRDSDDWEVIGPVEPRRLDSVMSVRLTAAEAEELRDAARRAGVTLSAYLRLQALNAARGPRLNLNVGYPAVTSGGSVAEVMWLAQSAVRRERFARLYEEV